MLRVAIQMDPIEAVDIESDTTFLQAMEAQNRGYPVWVYDFRTLALEALSRARSLDDPTEAHRQISVDRVRLQLN